MDIEKTEKYKSLETSQQFSDSSDSEGHSSSKIVKLNALVNNEYKSFEEVNDGIYNGIERAGPSKKLPSWESSRKTHSPTDSDESEEEKRQGIPGEYDPRAYEDLKIDDDDAREILQFITKYTPQRLNVDCKFKPFIPEYIPAVGDIDAFLKVLAPDTMVSGSKFDENSLQLGLKVLDEPAANQSDPALLYLQLRATNVSLDRNNEVNVVVKKIENIEKNEKVIDKWIKDIVDLHKSKSSSVVRYTEDMPDLDDLMQEWSEEMELKIKQEGFPKPGANTTITEYIKIVCEMFQIPYTKKPIHSLHYLFCLYAAIKQTLLYQASTVNDKSNSTQMNVKKDSDQLVIE